MPHKPAEPAKPAQMELPFSLLDLQGRTVLSVREVADRLHCTPRHVCEMIDAGELVAVNIGLGSRMAARVPVEAFRDFVIRSTTAPFAMSPLRHLPTQALKKLYHEIGHHLKQKGAL